MTEEAYRINPLLVHIVEDFEEEGMTTGNAIDEASKIFDKIPKDKRHLSAEPFTCPKCNRTFETEKYGAD